MGMFDYYQPDPVQHCPVCGHELRDWQGKHGPCLLFVWRQGFAAPVDQPITEESRMPLEERVNERLPDEFVIYTDCGGCARWIGLLCKTDNGVWVYLEMLDADTMIREDKERKRISQLTAARAREYVKKERKV